MSEKQYFEPTGMTSEPELNVWGRADYADVLTAVQERISGKLKEPVDHYTEETLKEIIYRDIRDYKVKCNLTKEPEVLVNYIYHDMAGYSWITRDGLFDKEGFEEININSWNDVEVVTGGVPEKTNYSFLSPEHAVNILCRIFSKTQTPFDVVSCHATADIGDGIRITAMRAPLIDVECGVVASIRKVNVGEITRDELLRRETLTEEMLDFLEICLHHGVSMCISGETGTGKTTLAASLLSTAADTLRIFTIEEGAREWNFIKRDANGAAVNSVVHTKTCAMQDEKNSVDQEILSKLALRFDPDIVAPGEIRGREAYEVMGVSNTGHTVCTTVHSNGTADTPERIVTLAKKAYDMSDATLYGMFARAFPILVHLKKGADRKRRVTEIREVTGCVKGEIQSNMLFEYLVEDNVYEGDTCVEVKGHFSQLAPISNDLVKRLLDKGARRCQLAPYMKKGGTK